MAISESLQLGLMGVGSLVAALLACDAKIDNDKLEKQITTMFEEQLELEVDEIDCPKDVKIEEDTEFECEVKTVKPSGKVPVVVNVTDVKKANVEIKTKYDVLNPKTLKKKAGLDCGKKVLLAKPGKKIKCTKNGVPTTGLVDDDGKLTWSQ